MSLDVSLYYKVEEDKKAYVFDANITHNLTETADKIGIYEYVWRPEEHNMIHAKELIKPLVEVTNSYNKYRKTCKINILLYKNPFIWYNI